MNREGLPKLMITRSHVNPIIEIYFEGEIIGEIEVELKGTHRAILRIFAPKWLRFVRAEIDRERKDRIIFPDVPRGTTGGKT